MRVHPLGGGMESIVVCYIPSRVCVKYETGATPHPQVRRVVIYAEAVNSGRVKIEAVVTEIPGSMRKELLDIIRDNEANYGHYTASVILPDGRLFHG